MSILSPIHIKNFEKNYQRKHIMLKDITIQKRVTILVGENGSGKSTILKALLKLISYKGTIENGNTLSYMPENPFFPHDITVSELLDNLIHKNNNDYDYNRFLTIYRLKEKENEVIRSLSKGMKAKLNLIQCLMKDADVYLLDEPFTGLDEESIKILSKEIKQSTKSFIISSHLEDFLKDIDKEVIHIVEYSKNTL